MDKVAKIVLVLCVISAAGLFAARACDPPEVVINSPGAGRTVLGPIPIQVTVTGSEEWKVVGVDFYHNDMLLATISAAPWTYNWDTHDDPDGVWKIYARVRAIDRKDVYSSTLTITVKNEK
jgi:hypothetical protein